MEAQTKTPFEIAQEQAKAGLLQTPSVSLGTKQINYFWYQLSVHKYNLSLMSKGLTFRGIILRDLKVYYGLKGRSAIEVLPQFIKIMEEFKVKHNINPQPNEQKSQETTT